MRKGGGENGKWTERERGVVMVECINVQLACHAPPLEKEKNTILQQYKSPFVCLKREGLRGHSDELLTFGWRQEAR